MKTVSFEWQIDHRADGDYVIERKVGTEEAKEYGPLDPRISESYLRARRDSVRRQMYKRGRVKLLTN